MRHPIPRLALLVLAAGLGAGCRDRPTPTAVATPVSTPEPPARIPDVRRDTGYALRTPALRYQLRREADGLAVDLPYSFANGRDSAIYVTACRHAQRLVPAVALEKEVTPGKWVHAWDPLPDPACDTVALVVAPGGTYADTLRVLGSVAGDTTVPGFTAPPPQGVYRLTWDALRSFDLAVPGLGPGLPAPWRLSNRFVLDPHG